MPGSAPPACRKNEKQRKNLVMHGLAIWLHAGERVKRK